MALDVNFDDQLVLIGVDRPGAALPADAAVPVTLDWRAQTPPQADYSTTVQVWDAAGNLWAQSDAQHPGRVPTTRWRTDQYALDAHTLRLPPGAPPGDYRLVVGVYQVGGPSLSVLDAARAPRGHYADLGTLHVTRGAVSDRWRPDTGGLAGYALGDLTLLSVEPARQTVQTGDEIVLTVYWQAAGAARPDVTLRVELAAQAGGLVAAWDRAPARADYPPSAWALGEIVRGVWRLRVPAAAEGGPASLRVTVLDAGGNAVAGPAVVAEVAVTVPARSFAVPPMQTAVGARLGAGVTLLGYDLAPGGAGVTLYWRAEAPLDTRYTAFVHALDAAGGVRAQVDQVPAGGARPTTGWLPGEVIADAYALPLAAARALEVGLYDPATGERLGAVTLPLP
jgi:hypothetical protein